MKTSAAVPPLLPLRPGVKPLSYQQRGWLAAEATGSVGWRSRSNGTSTNIFGCVRARGAIDTATLRAAASEVVSRHGALRMIVRKEQGATMQLVSPRCPEVQVRTMDLSTNSLEQAGRLFEHAVAEELLRPFELSGAEPLLRLTVGKLSSSESAVAIVMPHFVSDAASLRICIQDLLACYDEALGGGANHRPSGEIDYGDFAAWQRRWLRTAANQHLCDEYLELLRGARTLTLHGDTASLEAHDPYRARQLTYEVDVACAAGIRSVALRLQTAPFAVIVSAYLAGLSRVAGEEDLLIAVPMLGRRHIEIVRTIGFFACIVLIRVDVTGDPTLRGLIARVGEVFQQATKFDGMPYGFLHERAREKCTDVPALTISANVVGVGRPSDVTLVGDTEWRPWGLSIPENAAVPLTRYDLNLLVDYDVTGVIHLVLRYRSAVVDVNTVRAIASEMTSILAHVGSGRSLETPALERPAPIR